MTYPPADFSVHLPAAVSSLIGRRPYEVVWINELGGLTFRVEDGAEFLFLKWSSLKSGLDLLAEARRLEWASSFTPVPAVIESGSDDEGTWLLTQGLEAQSAVSPRWREEPATATKAIGEGLRALHDALPVGGCPFTWSADERLAVAERRVEAGDFDGLHLGREFADVTIERALDELRSIPESDLVVCHGDACAPNTLLAADGSWAAHVDLGRLGIADRWADLAIASWSTSWNYGPGWEESVYRAYGVGADHAKIRYYRLLWELS